jgi:hypothetical protein
LQHDATRQGDRAESDGCASLLSYLLNRVPPDLKEGRLVSVGQRRGDRAILAHDEIDERRRLGTGSLQTLVFYEAVQGVLASSPPE